MALRCVVCKQVPKVVGKRVEHELKKRWCAPGAYRKPDTVWCVPCWEKQVADLAAEKARDDAKFAARVAKLLRGE